MKRIPLVLPLFLAACDQPRPLAVTVSRDSLVASGYDQAMVRVTGSKSRPVIDFVGDSHHLHLSEPARHGDEWQSIVTSSILPGRVTLRVSSPGHATISRKLEVALQSDDFASDGTPDFLRLDEESDRAAFRRWFTFLAEAQYFNTPTDRPAEITDCAALLRYAYHEALHNHDTPWSSGVHLPLMPALESVQKYSVPHTPLGPNVFRIRAGAYQPSDLSEHTFSEFADVEALRRFNTYFIGHDLALAQPGDLLFYKRSSKAVTYHSMIFVGRSQVSQDDERYVVYHTGPEGSSHLGEMRRLSVKQLLHFSDPQWRSVALNPVFLGVYRWNILKTPS